MLFLNTRYEKLETISSTDNYKVYKVLDLEDSKIYDFKIFNKKVDKGFISSFADDFFAYSKLRHPNILKDYEFDIINESENINSVYFAKSEHLDKQKCIRYTTLDFEDRMKALEKIVYALKYIHFKNLSYKNLEYNNINIFRNEDGEIDVKLNSLSNINENINFSYLANKPDLKNTSVKLKQLNRSTDIYSLAIVSYYLITGKDYATKHVDLDGDIKEKYPKTYAAFLAATGSYEYRPHSIDDIWDALHEELGISKDFWDKSAYEKVDFHLNLIGQEKEIKLIENLILDFYNDSIDMNTIFIKSSSGMGKTRFSRELRYKLSMKGLNPLYCDLSIYEESSEDYAYFSEIARQLISKFKLPAKFIKEYGYDIAKIAPKLSKNWDISESIKVDESAEDTMLSSRLLKLVMELSLSYKFVIILDDVDKLRSFDLNILYNIMTSKTSKKPMLILSGNQMPPSYDDYDFPTKHEFIELSKFNHHHNVTYLRKSLFLDLADAKSLSRYIYPIVHGSPKNMERLIRYLLEKQYIYMSDNRKFMVKEFDLDEVCTDGGFEKIDVVDEFDFDSYIFHLVHSKKEREAIDELLKKCREMYQKNEYFEILDYLSFAKSIEKNVNDTELKLRILVEESEASYEVGDITSLMQIYDEILALAESQDFVKYKLYALIKVCDLHLTMQKIDEFEAIYSTLIINSNDIEKLDTDDKFDIKILKLRYLSKQKESLKLKEEASELIEIVDAKTYPKLNAMANYYLAIAYYQLKEFSRAFQIMYSLVNSLDKDKYPRQFIKFYNIMGEICHYAIHDDGNALKYLNVANKLVIENNLQMQNCTLYLNMARTMESIGQFDNAYENYKIAESIANPTMQYSLLFEILNDSTRLLIHAGKYQVAENKISRFESLKEKTDIYIDPEQYYYNKILKVNLYIVYTMLDEAKELLDEIRENGLEYLRVSFRSKYEIMNFLHYYLSKISNNTSLTLEELEKIDRLADNPSTSRDIKDFILNIAIHSFALEDFESYMQSIALLPDKNDTVSENILGLKLRYINAIRNNIDLKAVNLLLLKEDDDSLSYLWKLYYISGNLELQKGNSRKALALYYEAVDKYIDKHANMPEKESVYCVNNDVLFNKLIEKLNVLSANMYDIEPFTAIEIYYNRAESLRKKILNDTSLKEIVGSFYIGMHHRYMPTVRDYICSMTDDTEENIQNMLLFFAHTTIAERAALVILDEDGNKAKTFTTTDDEYPSDLDTYFSKIRKSEDFIYIEKNTDITGPSTGQHSLSFAKNNKNILVFPICNKDYTEIDFNRKADIYTQTKENIIAYVYLESNLSISKINLESLTQIKTYDGLNSLVINHYNMYIRSSIDKLTGVFIRNIVEKHVDNIIKKMENENYNFSLLMIDIDKFKAVNDNFGHRRGDEILSKLGKCLNTSTKKNDVIGRYGGEEFIAIINNSDSKTGLKVAERLRKRVEQENLLGRDGNLTISIGMSTYPKDGKHFAELVENADKALYHSKRNGRNQVTAYSKNIATLKHDVSAFSGVFSTDASENAIKIKAMLDILALLSWEMKKEEKLKKALEIMLDVIDGKCIYIVEDGKIKANVCKFAEKKNVAELKDKILNKVSKSGEGGYFVDWDENEGTDKKNQGIGELNLDPDSYAFAKIIKNGEEYGSLVAHSSISIKEYSYKDYNYILSLSSAIGAIIAD